MRTAIAEPRIEVPATCTVEELPILPLRDGTLFPRAALPLTIGRPTHLALVVRLGEDQRIGIIGQRNPEADSPQPSDLYEIGTMGVIHKILRVSKDHIFAFCEGIARFRITEFTATEPDLKAKVELFEELEPVLTPELEALRDDVVETFQKIVAATPDLPDELQLAVPNLSKLGTLADFAAAAIPGLTSPERQELLAQLDVKTRLGRVNQLLVRELERVELRQKIFLQAKDALNDTQREFFLREQLKAIQKELGESEDAQKDVEDLRKKIDAVGMPSEVKGEVGKELNRLARLSPMSPEYGVSRSYLEWMVSLPWSTSTATPVDVNYAAKVLDEDHYSLEKVKDRILDHLVPCPISN